MWRFTRKLINTAVYLKKTLDIFGMRYRYLFKNQTYLTFSISATVYGLWVTGDPYRVSSGYITKDTKVFIKKQNLFEYKN